MADMILGVFSNKDLAKGAIDDLKTEGYDAKDISIVMHDIEDAQTIATNTGASVADGAATGATTGGAIGGLAGLLVGIGAIAIPGLGAILIGGPLAAALGLTGAAATTVSGAVTGALAGGLVGALVGLGVPEEEAHVYEDRVREGGVLLAVPVREGGTREARVILEEAGADNVRLLNYTK